MLLAKAPDFATLWNYRREILLTRKKELAQDAFQKRCEAEVRREAVLYASLKDSLIHHLYPLGQSSLTFFKTAWGGTQSPTKCGIRYRR